MLRKDRPLVSIVGAGNWGKNLVRNFYQLGAVKSVFDENLATMNRMTEYFPGISAASSIEEIFADSEVAGVALATPAISHYELAKQSLLAGKHVFVEKPMALSSREGLELVKLAEAKGQVLMVDHVLQNHPAYIKMRELIASGELGRIRYVNSRRQNWGIIKLHENALWSFGPHDLSMVLGLVNAMPVRVSALGGAWITTGIDDMAECHLEFEGGIQAHISVSWLNPIKESRLVVVGNRKMAVFNDILPWPEKLKLYAHRIDWTDQVPVVEKTEAEACLWWKASRLRLSAAILSKPWLGGKSRFLTAVKAFGL